MFRFAGFSARALTASLLTIALLGSAVVSGTQSAKATTSETSPVPGLIVELASPSSNETAIATLANKYLKVEGTHSANIGANWYSLKFPHSVSAARAWELVSALKRAKLIKTAEFDQVLDTSSVKSLQSGSSLPSIRVFTASKSNLVKNLTVTDAYDPTRPLKAYLKASWKPPTVASGAKVVGYRIQLTTDFAQSFSAAIFTKQPSMLLGPTHGIVTGVATGVRVAPVLKTNKGSSTGTYSGIAYQIPTGLPGKPQFKGERVATTNKSPSWFLPSLEQAGGLPVTFTATASAPGVPSITCVTSATTCQFQGLKANVSYSVRLVAKNERGSATSEDLYIPMDPKYKQQWNLGSSGIHVDSAWEHGRGSPRIVVAVIDSGVTAHPDLDSQFLRNIDGSIAGYDFVSKQVGSGDGSGWDSNPTDPSARNDWHGTLVSGVIAAAANGSGVIGVAPETKLLPIRSMGETGGLISDTVAAIYWAIGEKIKDVPLNKNPAKIINLSIGNGLGLGCDASAKKALELASRKGVTVVTAAGNDSKPTYYSFPGNCGLSVNVAASTKSGDLAKYSDFGPLVDLTAPGGEQSGGDPAIDVQTLGILTTSNSGTSAPGAASYEVVEGTSFAAPQVTGVIALMLSLRSTLRPAEVEKILRNTATRYASGTFCQKQVADLPCGDGIVNASAAIDAVLSLP